MYRLAARSAELGPTLKTHRVLRACQRRTAGRREEGACWRSSKRAVGARLRLQQVGEKKVALAFVGALETHRQPLRRNWCVVYAADRANTEVLSRLTQRCCSRRPQALRRLAWSGCGHVALWKHSSGSRLRGRNRRSRDAHASPTARHPLSERVGAPQPGHGRARGRNRDARRGGSPKHQSRETHAQMSITRNAGARGGRRHHAEHQMCGSRRRRCW